MTELPKLEPGQTASVRISLLELTWWRFGSPTSPKAQDFIARMDRLFPGGKAILQRGPGNWRIINPAKLQLFSAIPTGWAKRIVRHVYEN